MRVINQALWIWTAYLSLATNALPRPATSYSVVNVNGGSTSPSIATTIYETVTELPPPAPTVTEEETIAVTVTQTPTSTQEVIIPGELPGPTVTVTAAPIIEPTTITIISTTRETVHVRPTTRTKDHTTSTHTKHATTTQTKSHITTTRTKGPAATTRTKDPITTTRTEESHTTTTTLPNLTSPIPYCSNDGWSASSSIPTLSSKSMGWNQTSSTVLPESKTGWSTGTISWHYKPPAETPTTVTLSQL